MFADFASCEAGAHCLLLLLLVLTQIAARSAPGLFQSVSTVYPRAQFGYAATVGLRGGPGGPAFSVFTRERLLLVMLLKCGLLMLSTVGLTCWFVLRGRSRPRQHQARSGVGAPVRGHAGRA
jgi:hypothetical protein